MAVAAMIIACLSLVPAAMTVHYARRAAAAQRRIHEIRSARMR